jgi:hypothetical protein
MGERIREETAEEMVRQMRFTLSLEDMIEWKKEQRKIALEQGV